MAKTRSVFACRSCGSTFPRWIGRCPDCGTWDALEEQKPIDSATAHLAGWTGQAPEARSIADIGADVDVERMSTGIGELDRVFGSSSGGHAGLVRGSVVLVGGEPGVGKSTLLLQAAAGWASRGHRVLYVSSEESAEQIRLRADRLELGAPRELFLLAETSLERIAEQARVSKPAIVLIDSVQMIASSRAEAAPGSMTQLRQCGADFVTLAKSSGMAVVLVGHVTKDGQLAGPRLLEHLVDAVLYFEGDRLAAARVVRAVKNRYGATLELGIFGMTGRGLAELPGGASVRAGSDAPRPGVAVCPVIHGSRCVLAEVQALTATGFVGAAKRKSSGLDSSRLAMLIAVLEQHGGIRLADRDVFAQVVGGLRVVEPAADLAVLLAIAGAERRKALERGVCAVGEVNLSGQVTGVPQLEQRLTEAGRMGFGRVLLPFSHEVVRQRGVEVTPIRSVQDALEHLS
ncbi:MAG: DNA repair protein RadA [Phycisphaeraceae bacterium]|nr:DNA repair protein RadA [Phycisphaeraceae bacterium]MCW5761647.1 DNA repair protein RadA [Phycisphaeraceae bacterium]